MSDIEHISKQVEHDRARLAQSLDALTDTVHPQTVAHDMSSAATDIGSQMLNKAWGSLRDNPAGGLLVTIGMGLLASGSQRRSMPTPTSEPTAVDPDAALVGFDARVAQADRDMRADMTGELSPKPEASRLKAAVDAGLDKLPANARKRVIKARQAAISAQETIERQARETARRTKGFVYEQPLTVGALAIGFGILAGSLLPGTRREDDLLGKRRDALMADARHILEEELQNVRAQAETVLAKNKDQIDTTARI